ncbi:MAG: sensor histidine kinase, partial [Oscillospiraceae bacterium]
MRAFFGSLMKRISNLYRKSSIQLIISVSFTLVAVVGMLFMGASLFARFSASTDALLAEDSRRVLDQVNLSLDSYLRSMMRVSDTMYYRVIKNADLAEDSLDDRMNLLYETNRDTLVSIAVFAQNGELVSATPLSNLKKGVVPDEQDWFIAAVEKIENLHFSTPHVQNLFDDPDYLYRWVVSVSRQVELT